ncbi:hypothetical protein [Niabella beijingensis]|uniref:hypothetical protein n=1 Tax=Niabella beijingensis TaxID=2872700 RepID=UPI001CC083F1|nr:hypothetical protein [Niabella beijingensis]MBZ4191317.1 hypothetical protein [Niabella beijingensis]
MEDPKLQQIRYEYDAWKRAVSFIMEESIIMKNRLAEVLKKDFNSNLLEGIELLQNKLIRNDERIGIFRDDLNQFDELATGTQGKQDFQELETRVRLLHDHLLQIEKQFTRLKSEFNHYLLDHMGMPPVSNRPG